MLMAMDVKGFGRRIALSRATKLKAPDVALALLQQGYNLDEIEPWFSVAAGDTLSNAIERRRIRWSRDTSWEQKADLYPVAFADRPFLEWLDLADRAEQVDQKKLYTPIWPLVNKHLGTQANSIPELAEQLGIGRFGKRPIVGDAFCGGGSIPFEAARLGCDIVASDLNPVACMLTWGALNIVGANAETRKQIQAEHKEVAASVDAEITALGIEHNTRGDRAKAYLYCLETRCPQTGYMVPMLPSRIISRSRRSVVMLKPDLSNKCFDMLVSSNVSEAEMAAAEKGTVEDGELVVTIDGETHRTPIRTIRGDRRDAGGDTLNALRQWEKHDFMPRANDIFQERLFAIQWITKETIGARRQETYFAGLAHEDYERERRIAAIVHKNLVGWQQQGLVPDMQIEKGEETNRLARERGWTHWHHLFTPRDLIVLSLMKRNLFSPWLYALWPRTLNHTSKMCQWLTSLPRVDSETGQQLAGARDIPNHVFYNQALNTFVNYAGRSVGALLDDIDPAGIGDDVGLTTRSTVSVLSASEQKSAADYWITDPPYADAIRYEEITEFFIAWLRKNSPKPFEKWIWDSRRPLAIKGSGEGFKNEMIAAYRNLATQMPDTGLQIVMFTHQGAEVWADMAAIMWGSGLQVTAAWYVATETTSELKKGGYVQGTVLLILRKRQHDETGYRDEITQEIRTEVAHQVGSLTGLNGSVTAHGRSENLFEDADLQMAGYAAALRVLTSYSRIDGEDMAAYASRPRIRGRPDPVKEIIDFAVESANSQLVPAGLDRTVWALLTAEERFYMKMLDLEAVGLRKLDNYQNFAKAFRADWQPLMASLKPNAARLKKAAEFNRAQFGDGFGETPTRRILWAMQRLQAEDPDGRVILEELRTTPRYFERREAIKEIVLYIVTKRNDTDGEAARVLADLIENERIG